MREEQLWSRSWYINSQGDNELYMGVHVCHEEFKMTFAHPVCSSKTFSSTNDYSKHEIHLYFKILIPL